MAKLRIIIILIRLCMITSLLSPPPRAAPILPEPIPTVSIAPQLVNHRFTFLPAVDQSAYYGNSEW